MLLRVNGRQTFLKRKVNSEMMRLRIISEWPIAHQPVG